MLCESLSLTNDVISSANITNLIYNDNNNNNNNHHHNNNHNNNNNNSNNNNHNKKGSYWAFKILNALTVAHD